MPKKSVKIRFLILLDNVVLLANSKTLTVPYTHPDNRAQRLSKELVSTKQLRL